MAIDQRKYDMPLVHTLRDTRPFYIRLNEFMQDPLNAAFLLGIVGVMMLLIESLTPFADIMTFFGLWYVCWLKSIKSQLLFRMPAWSKLRDKTIRSGKAEGILYLGTRKDGSSFWHGEEVWFTNNDIRTHFLYLGTTGSGKTEGLKSMVSNALTWGSGFVFIDGKADTDLWSTLSALVRRFGRDDDLFVLNYMTGNSDIRAPSNSLNPFSSGSASYLTNMLVSLMPVADGDNAMWKERAISLLSSLMPSLTWLRDHMNAPLSVSTIRRYMQLPEIIRLSRLEVLPTRQRESLKGYLTTLPGYVDEAFDDYGRQKPMGPGTPMVDVQVPQQQHGYLTMQFTRSLQSLGDDYGYIFDTDKADVDMVDVVLNRRILVVLIPALEKSSDETANLGKIVAATIKGMMGSTLGATVEGDSTAVIENKPTYSSTPFMCVFDEVGYYTAQGMAVMAAQARSLGFSLVFAAQDLPAMEKRVKEEARSITANCNIKIFGKLEDPTQTVEFMEKSAGKAIVTEVSSFAMRPGSTSSSYFGTEQASRDLRFRITQDNVRMMKEGEAALMFGLNVVEIKVFYANIGHAKALRVQRLIGLDPLDDNILKHKEDLVKLRDRLVNAHWKAAQATHSADDSPELAGVLASHAQAGLQREDNLMKRATASFVAYIAATDPESLNSARRGKPPETGEQAPAKEGDPMRFFSGDKKSTAPAQERSFDELIDDEGDEEEEGESSGGSDSRRMKKTGPYDPDRATEETMASGRIALPDGLRPEVEQVLRDAAKTLTTGLFAKPGTGLARGGLPVVRPAPPAARVEAMAAERGNALFLILLGIVLFGALTAAVTSGFRGSNAALSKTRIEALASDTIMSGTTIENAVGKLIAKDNSESRLSFTRSSGDGYELTPPESASEKVFNSTGGGAQYLDPAKDVLDTTRSAEMGYGSWLFTGHDVAVGFGSDSQADLIAILPYVRRDICTAINDRLNVTNPTGVPPVEADQMDVATKFTGTFNTTRSINVTGAYTAGKKAACIQGNQNGSGGSISGRYYFYYVLLAR